MFYSGKLRARQKERLSNRGNESISPLPPPRALKDLGKATSTHPVEEPAADNLGHNHNGQIAGPSSTTGPTMMLGQTLKQKSGFHADIPLISSGQQIPEVAWPSEQLPDMSSMDAERNNLLPVLGLCAPNAPKNTDRLRRKGSRPSQRQLGIGLEFPLPAATSSSFVSNEMAMGGHEPFSARYHFPDSLTGTSQLHPQGQVSDKYLPFNPVSFPIYPRMFC